MRADTVGSRRKWPFDQLVQQWCPVEEDLVASDQAVLDGDRAHAVALDDPLAVGDHGVPVVQESSAERSHPRVRPHPVRVAGQQTAKVPKDLVVAPHAIWDSRIGVDRVVGIEGD